jgi:hypothetical protein
LQGELWCASGRARDGLELLLHEIDINVPLMVEEMPALARVRSAAGLCALKLGDRKRAEALAAQARKAFELQPEVSPWYKATLFKLKHALGLKLPAI